MIDWTDNIKEFISKKLQEENLKMSDLSKITDVSITTMRGIINKTRRPEIKNIVKLANYFHCSIDEMLGRDPHYYQGNKGYRVNLSLEELSYNLKIFIKKEMDKRRINQYQLGREIGRGEDSIRHFLRED